MPQKPFYSDVCTVYLIGCRIDNNYFEMYNIDMCGADKYNKGARTCELARRHIMGDCKKYGDLASIPWGHQFGSWYKHFIKSNP